MNDKINKAPSLSRSPQRECPTISPGRERGGAFLFINSIVSAHENVNKFYPTLGSIEGMLQLGVLIKLLGALRVELGHSKAEGTIRDYIHILSVDTQEESLKECCEFLDREIFGITKSRMDIDLFKTAGKTNPRPELRTNIPDDSKS